MPLLATFFSARLAAFLEALLNTVFAEELHDFSFVVFGQQHVPRIRFARKQIRLDDDVAGRVLYDLAYRL